MKEEVFCLTIYDEAFLVKDGIVLLLLSSSSAFCSVTSLSDSMVSSCFRKRLELIRRRPSRTQSMADLLTIWGMIRPFLKRCH